MAKIRSGKHVLHIRCTNPDCLQMIPVNMNAVEVVTLPAHPLPSEERKPCSNSGRRIRLILEMDEFIFPRDEEYLSQLWYSDK